MRGADATVVVATLAHRREFEAALAAAGIDVDAATREGRYLAFDAAEVMSRFMVSGRPDAARFRAAVGGVLDRASEGGRKVRVYGEMVALLWGDGDGASAVALEDLWNDIAQTRPFALLCAYPLRGFDDQESGPTFKRICEQHTTVIPSEGYSLLADPAERSRAIAQLQQQNAALRAEVLRLRTQQGVDGAGEQRDVAGIQRDVAGLERDEAGVQRDHAGEQRDEAGMQRDEAGMQRDVAGLQRDEAGMQRDQAADRRDEAAEQRDHAAERSEASASPAITTDALNRSALARREAASDRRRASQDRLAGASERTEAELDRDTALADRDTALSDRDTALADRGAGASERTEAELDRDTALTDRGASARERDQSSHDALTGAYLRGEGFVVLDREIARARRIDEPLVLAFVDVDGLKAINDSRGHAAGDRMLSEVAKAFRARLRSYDILIRYGGDEFLCAISGLDGAAAAKRVALVNATLAAAPEHGSVTAGLAELGPGDSRDELVARADAALYRERKQRRAARP